MIAKIINNENWQLGLKSLIKNIIKYDPNIDLSLVYNWMDNLEEFIGYNDLCTRKQTNNYIETIEDQFFIQLKSNQFDEESIRHIKINNNDTNFINNHTKQKNIQIKTRELIYQPKSIENLQFDEYCEFIKNTIDFVSSAYDIIQKLKTNISNQFVNNIDNIWSDIIEKYDSNNDFIRMERKQNWSQEKIISNTNLKIPRDIDNNQIFNNLNNSKTTKKCIITYYKNNPRLKLQDYCSINSDFWQTNEQMKKIIDSGMVSYVQNNTQSNYKHNLSLYCLVKITNSYLIEQYDIPKNSKSKEHHHITKIDFYSNHVLNKLLGIYQLFYFMSKKFNCDKEFQIEKQKQKVYSLTKLTVLTFIYSQNEFYKQVIEIKNAKFSNKINLQKSLEFCLEINIIKLLFKNILKNLVLQIVKIMTFDKSVFYGNHIPSNSFNTHVKNQTQQKEIILEGIYQKGLYVLICLDIKSCDLLSYYNIKMPRLNDIQDTIKYLDIQMADKFLRHKYTIKNIVLSIQAYLDIQGFNQNLTNKNLKYIAQKLIDYCPNDDTNNFHNVQNIMNKIVVLSSRFQMFNKMRCSDEIESLMTQIDDIK